MISIPFLRRSNLDMQPGCQFCEVTSGGIARRVEPPNSHFRTHRPSSLVFTPLQCRFKLLVTSQRRHECNFVNSLHILWVEDCQNSSPSPKNSSFGRAIPKVGDVDSLLNR